LAVGKVNVALIGSGNIGTDLMVKALRSTQVAPVWMVGIDPKSDGLARAREAGLKTTDQGLDGLLPHLQRDDIRIAFDATSAYVHREHAQRLREFAAVCERMGVHTGVDLYRFMDVAEDLVVPMMDQPIRVDRESLILGYAGVYSSFLLFSQRAAQKYGVSARDVLVEMGRRKAVGGQEDLIEEVALELRRRAPAADAPETRSLSAVS
jgi:threonine dehydrogenase-like Zn-dependent dehydrogenase